MTTRNIWSELSFVAVLGVCGGCSLSSSPMGTGGATGESGATGAAGASGAMGTSGAPGAAGMPTSSAKYIKCTNPTPPATDAMAANKGPCDIYALDGGPCIAAHSTVRALYAAYAGPLYQVKKTDGSTKDINVLAPGGFANSMDQDTFCGIDACTISIIYDQSGRGNNLTSTPAGGGAKPAADGEANAKALPATFSGHKVYGVHIVQGIGYRNNNACDTAIGDDAETEYMIVDGAVHNTACCFDYGNMERNTHDNGEGTMEAVYYGRCTVWGRGADKGPWVMGDLENGLWAGNFSPYPASTPVTFPYVTAMVKGDKAGSNHWAIKVGNAQMGALATPFDGPRPSSAYNPMRKEGAIGMGTGGDNSNGATGNFFEGVMTAAFSSNMADDAVQANIVAAYAAAAPAPAP